MSGSLSYFKRLGQPIVALATAPGGPVAVIRVSGHDLSFLEPLLGIKEKAGTFKLRPLSVGKSDQDRRIVDHAVVLFFENPHSFTGEDVVEIQCHGIESTLQILQSEICRLGALLALPGEFSFRALSNGKMTLTEAESLQQAFATEGIGVSWASQLLGFRVAGQSGIEERLASFLLDLSAARGRIEAAIDFPEAEAEQASEIASALIRIEKVMQAQSALLSTYQNFCASAGHPKVAIIGQPNAGKSTLLNILCGGTKALVSALAGTTRDLVEGRLRLSSGKWVVLYDTAGIRPESGLDLKDSHEQIELAGIELGLDAAKNSSLLIWVRNAQYPETRELEKIVRELDRPTLEIYSHGDLVRTEANNLLPTFDFIKDNAKLQAYVLSWIESALKSGTALSTVSDVISLRQQQHLLASFQELELAENSLKGLRPMELAGEHVRSAEEHIRKSLGQGLSDEYIGQIFSQFCLGK